MTANEPINKQLNPETEALKKRLSELQEANARQAEQLQEALAENIAKETFLSNMSHDIRTPMNAIIGMTALAQKHIDEKARVVDALEKIEVASSHLLSLINDVLDMSRINSGKLTIADDPFSLGDLLHDMLVIVRPQADKKGHTLRFETEHISAETLRGDAVRLQQIFVNIINNAVKYTNDGGNILVSVSETAPDPEGYALPASSAYTVLEFVCRDNGMGMSEEFLARIFTPFERVRNSTISGIEGTGLGMSIVKKLIDAMHGTIDVQSRLQQGTTVTIRIPLAVEQEASDTNTLEGRQILILECDEALRELFREYLSEAGAGCRMVRSASDAIEAIIDADEEKKPFDGMIIGSRIGQDESIYDIAGYVSKARPGMPIILVSGENWEEIEYRAGRSGIGYFIPTPFFRKSLLRGLGEAMHATGTADSFASTPDLTGRRILLAEDNMINMEIAKEVLGYTNAEVDTAMNGKEAAEVFAASPENYYDLILMDIQMPVMDGYEAARTIRAMDRADAQKITIYAMTANTFAEDVARAREAGMNGHIAKPIDINLLMQMLRNVLR